MAKKKVKKGVKIPQECLTEAKAALNLFNADELKQYVSDVMEKARSYDDLGGKAALNKAIKEVNQQEKNILLGRATIKVNNIIKFDRLESKMKKGVDLAAFLHRTNINKDENVETAQRTAQQLLYKDVFAPMSKEQEELLISGKMDDELFAVMDGKKHKNSDVNFIAKLIGEYPEEVRNPAMIKSNAILPEEINKDRFLRNFYNGSRVASAGQSLVTRALSKNKVNADSPMQVWKKDQLAALDLRKTAKAIGAIDKDGNIMMGKLERMIETAFDNIIHERSAIFVRSTTVRDREAVERTRRMYFHYKDWASWGKINKKYGRGTLHQALLADMHGSANTIGMAQIFGDSPDSIFNELRHVQRKIRPLSNTANLYTDAMYHQVRGVDKTSWSPTIANIGAANRMLTSMSRLGALALNSLSDISQVGGIAQRFGYGYWKPYINGIIHAFNLIPSENRKILAKMLKMNLDTHVGYVGRFIDATDTGEMVRKASNTFFWANFTNAFDKGNKLSAVEPISMGMARDSKKAFKELHPQTQAQLSKFNITPHEWDALRTKTQGKLFTLDNVDRLSNDEIAALWEKSDKSEALTHYRDALYRKVYAFFDTITENAVLDPRAYERMLTTANLSAGHPFGQAVRMFMQFKAYPLANFRRIWYGGMKDFDSARAKFMYAINMSAGNFMLGYLSMVLGALSKGLTPPDPGKMSASEKWAFLLRLLAPGAGTFLKVLDAQNQNSKMLINLIFTPSVRLFTDPMAAGFALATGHPKQALNDVKEFARFANPIGTVPIAEPYFDSLFGKKPYLEPGQKPLL